jgi:hypothetical protein
MLQDFREVLRSVERKTAGGFLECRGGRGRFEAPADFIQRCRRLEPERPLATERRSGFAREGFADAIEFESAEDCGLHGDAPGDRSKQLLSHA